MDRQNIPCTMKICKQTYSWGSVQIRHREQTNRETDKTDPITSTPEI